VDELSLAVDVGATKLAVGLVNLEGEVVTGEVVPTPRSDDPEAVFGALAAAVGRVLRQTAGAASVCGVGCGGPMAGDRVSPLNIPAWREFPLRQRLGELTGLATYVDNDAKALALGEWWRGAAVGSDDFIAIVVSTGVGGGVVLDGRLLDGRLGNAGHIGHVVVEPEGRRCPCGGQGCLEAEASGTAIAQITGRPAEEADAEMVCRTGTLVGRAVASVANLLDLDLAVVAGSVALGFGEPFFAAAQQEVGRRARLDFSRATVVRAAGLGAAGPVVGAGAVGWRGAGRLTAGSTTTTPAG
jgi:glucokinase